MLILCRGKDFPQASSIVQGLEKLDGCKFVEVFSHSWHEIAILHSFAFVAPKSTQKPRMSSEVGSKISRVSPNDLEKSIMSLSIISLTVSSMMLRS